MSKTENKSSLEALYPFLNNKKADAANMNKMLLNSIEHKMQQHQSVINEFFSKNNQAVVHCAQLIADMYKQHKQLFTMGNGGSSSDASHIAVEFLHPVTTGRPALPAYDLSCDKTLITAIANDVGYQHVYSRLVDNLLKENDALIGVSTSGNSDNLIKAFSKAQEKGVVTIALTGGNGGEIAKIGLDCCLVVESDSIHRIQECHVATYHILWDLVHTLLADDRGYLGKENNPDSNNKVAEKLKKELKNEIC